MHLLCAGLQEVEAAFSYQHAAVVAAAALNVLHAWLLYDDAAASAGGGGNDADAAVDGVLPSDDRCDCLCFA